MFGYVETRDGDIPTFKPFAVERRSGRRRRRSPNFGNQDNKRHRNKFERELTGIGDLRSFGDGCHGPGFSH